MSRRPNPWITLPSLAAGLIGSFVGWIVTEAACRAGDQSVPITGCPRAAATMAVVGFLVGTLGMAVVVVLVARSIAEWRDASARGEEPPGPGCEV